MTTVSVLALLSAPDVQPWLLGAVTALRLATAAISFAIAVHRSVRYLRENAKPASKRAGRSRSRTTGRQTER